LGACAATLLLMFACLSNAMGCAIHRLLTINHLQLKPPKGIICVGNRG
jgi:hypothetical protein